MRTNALLFRTSASALLVITCALAPRAARAGGYEIPDNGTEALGRGGAFVAKADDGTALQYNIAGLARQRGTRVTLDLNLVNQDIAFTRAGVYPGDPSDMRTPWAGQMYPTIHNSERWFPAPFLGISTDFGWFKRWTFGFGIYGPPSHGRRNYGVGERAPGAADDPPAQVTLPNGMTAPAPSRYDIVKTDLLIIFPTLAAAYNINRYIDVGLALQLIYGSFNLASASITPLGLSNCPTPDYPGCDSVANIKTSGYGFTGILSVLAHPTDWLDVGVTYRLPSISRAKDLENDPTGETTKTTDYIESEGTLHPVSPTAVPTMIADAPVTFRTRLPQWLRLGTRLISRYADGTERADVEVDFVWENWSAEQASRIHSDDLPFGELNANVLHKYRDTFGVRAGGAYNFRLGEMTRLTTRVGAFFDSATTHYANTRLDFNTAAKYGITVGAGFKWRGLLVNLAYAYVYSPARDVTNSETLALSSISGDPRPNDAKIAVGNGRYEPTTHILSVGVTVNLPEFRAARLMPN